MGILPMFVSQITMGTMPMPLKSQFHKLKRRLQRLLIGQFD